MNRRPLPPDDGGLQEPKMKFDDTFSAETIVLDMFKSQEPGGGTGGIGAGDLAFLENENMRLRSVIQKVIGWLGQLEKQSAAQENQNRGRFDSLADACVADAKNYRATADSLRKALSR